MSQNRIDPEQVRRMQAQIDANVANHSDVDIEGFDPYSTTIIPGSLPRPARRTLDDMRKLSEEIKNARVWHR